MAHDHHERINYRDGIPDPTLNQVVALRDIPIIVPIGSEYRLDPGEFNGWGNIGIYDQLHSLDLGNVGAGVTNRVAGGLIFPFAVQPVRLYAHFRQDTAASGPWGFRLAYQTKTGGTNAVTSTDIFSEAQANGGVGPREYNNTTNQQIDLDLTVYGSIPALQTIVFGVESTAVGGGDIQVQSGFLQFERISV